MTGSEKPELLKEAPQPESRFYHCCEGMRNYVILLGKEL